MNNVEGLVGSQFNYYFEYKGKFFLYNTLNTNLYKIEKWLFDILKSNRLLSDAHAIEERLLKKLVQDRLIVSKQEDEEQTAKHIIQHLIYDNKLDVTIVPTQGCNFRCVYCFEEHNCNNRMTDESEEKIIKYFNKNIKNYKTVKISWFGGEPLLEKRRIVRIMEAINECGEKYGVPVISDIITNGYLLDVETFDRLVSNNILYYEITIDGLAKHHDRLRCLVNGKGTYDRIVKNITNIQKNSKGKRFRIIIRTNVDKNSVTEYRQFIEQMGSLLNYDKRFLFLESRIVDWGGNTVEKLDDNLIREGEFELTGLEYNKMPLFSYSAATHDLTQLRCNAGKYNGFVITHDARIQKCTKVSYNASQVEESSVNDLGCISKSGNLLLDESKCARFLRLPSIEDKCKGCCWLPICLLTMCPITCIKQGEILCKMKNDEDRINTEYNLISQYIRGYYEDLTIWEEKERGK